MSSSSPPNIGSVDLESVLNVGRRTLASIGESNLPRQQYRYSDTIYLKREDNSNSLLSINSKIVIFGELQFLHSIFERYTSNIIVHEDSIESISRKLSFSATFEDETIDETPEIISTSPSKILDNPIKRKTIGSIGRSPTTSSTTSDYSIHNLEGKRYGCIQLPNMMIIEILEILLRSGLELVDGSTDYDNENVLHQYFVLSKPHHVSHRLGQTLYSKTPSFAGT